MTNWNTEELIAADKQFVWHPFTNMPEWCAPEHEPIVIVEGHGALLRDSRGREYIDGNSSIWTNIHGHNHPRINRAIREQLERIAHSSFLGTTNPVAIELAREIVELFPCKTLSRVFYSDDGSTGIEAALRIAAQFFQMRGEKRNLFVAFRSGYHGDTAGAAALGAAKMFSVDHEGWRFPVRTVGSIEELEKPSGAQSGNIAAVVVEPMIQGAAGMRIWPQGTSAAVRDWCNQNGALMIADEVMTGFGRTGKMFASEYENALPDIMVLGKGLSGGYLPLAITLTTEEIFSQFDGSVADGRALAYGHSYTGNALGCAAARASLAIFREENVLATLQPKIRLDQALVERAFYQSREQAQRAIMAGQVRIGEQVAQKPSILVDPNAMIATAAAPRFVGRGGLKLEGALDFFGVDVSNQIAVDIGASTGGFTDCLLQRGARKVYAIDVGHGQLAWKIRNDSRVTVFEKTNARVISPSLISEAANICVIDVSFISLTLILPNAFQLVTPSGMVLALIKPQFELERSDVGRGGIVRDASLHEKAQGKVVSFVEVSGHEAIALPASVVAGAEGNRDFFFSEEKG